MKKNSYVEDFKNINVSGVYNMQEKSNFLCSKMMDIEDTVRISYNFTASDVENTPTNLFVAQRVIFAQSLLNVSHSYAKQEAIISLVPDKTQTDLDSNNLTKWIFDFNAKSLLREYLYNQIYTLNPHSPFREIPLTDIPGNKINQLCYDYIDKNVLSRYKLSDFILWTSYFELKNNTVPGSGTDAVINPVINLLYKTPVYSFNALPANTTTNSIQADVDKEKETVSMKQYADGTYEISYKQTKSSQYYTFLYYYDAIFERI